jgi:hypothetical protein
VVDKAEVKICEDVIALFDKFEFKGNVSDMVKSTTTLQNFARMMARHRAELAASEIKEEPKE